MSRQIRSDCRVGTLERKLGFEPGTIRNPKTGRDRRSDCKVGTLRAENARREKK